MTESLLNLGNDILQKISKEESVLDTLEKMKNSAKDEKFSADLIVFIDNDKTSSIGFKPSDKDIFIEIIDLMMKKQEECISSLKEQFANL